MPLIVVLIRPIVPRKSRKCFRTLAILLLVACFISFGTAPANACTPVLTAGAAGGAMTIAAVPAAPVIVVAAAVVAVAGIGWYIYEAEINSQDQGVPENTEDVPQKARDVVGEIEENDGKPLPGYEGGRDFNNYEGKLPKGTSYKEYDVNPKIKGLRRDRERVVIGEDGSAWYSPDHYNSFRRIK